MNDNEIMDIWQVAPNGDWATADNYGGMLGVPLGGYARHITLARNADGRLECFYVGTNDVLYHNWQTARNNGWAGEHSLGFTGQKIAFGQNADGRLELFFVGLDSHLYHMWQSTPGGPQWSGAAGLFLAGVNEVAVGSNQDGRLQVFFNGTDGDLYTDWQTAPNGSWHGASVLGGSSTGYRSLALARNADGNSSGG